MICRMNACPICSRPSAARAHDSARPFCSIRCKQIDLGKWLSEDYRVAVPLESDGDEGSLLTSSLAEEA